MRYARSIDTITFEKTARGTSLTYDANLTLKGIRYVGDFALHLAFQWIGRRALEGLRAELSTRRASWTRPLPRHPGLLELVSFEDVIAVKLSTNPADGQTHAGWNRWTRGRLEGFA